MPYLTVSTILLKGILLYRYFTIKFILSKLPLLSHLFKLLKNLSITVLYLTHLDRKNQLLISSKCLIVLIL